MPDENVTTPAGTEADPYLATTWAELVDYASRTGTYTKVANNIDVLTEYPDGNAPTLVLSGYVDGDNKTLSRWYCTGQRYMITTNNTTYIKNTIFTNIKTGYSLVYNLSDGNSNHITVQNCKFAGMMSDGFVFDGNRDTKSGKLNGITVNIKGANLKLLYQGGTVAFSNGNFNVKLKTSASYLWDSGYYVTSSFYDSYFELDAPDMTSISNTTSRHLNFDNCVIDLKTDAVVSPNTFPFDTGNSILTIVNNSHCPVSDATPNKILGVSDNNWHNAAFLASKGFNIVAGE